MTFGDLEPNGITEFNGGISLFLLYKNKSIVEGDIKLQHNVFCKRNNIDHDPITF